MNKKIISLLFDHDSLLFNINLDGITPLHTLIKINNNNLIKYMCDEHNISDLINNNNNIKSYMIDEYNNMLDKIIYDYDETKPLITLFKNINGNLYNNIKISITSQEIYGNNLLSNLEISFNICSYLIFHYLSGQLINIDSEYLYIDIKNLLNMVKININNIISKNHFILNLSENMNNEKYIVEELLKEKIEKYNIINKQITEFDAEIERIPEKTAKTARSIKNKFKHDWEYPKKSNIRENLIKEISILHNIKKKPRVNKMSSSQSSDNNFMSSYSKDKELFIIKEWEIFLNKSIGDNNNMLLINILLEQRKNIQNSNSINNKYINKGLKHISKLCEYYFNNNNKYIDDDPIL